MSLTSTVPAVVPSDFHSSLPWVPSKAEKYTVPPTATQAASHPDPRSDMCCLQSVP